MSTFGQELYQRARKAELRSKGLDITTDTPLCSSNATSKKLSSVAAKVTFNNSIVDTLPVDSGSESQVSCRMCLANLANCQ